MNEANVQAIHARCKNIKRLGRMSIGIGFFEKMQVDSETWEFGLITNEGELKVLSRPVAYVVVGR